jgi:hypothetical protein
MMLVVVPSLPSALEDDNEGGDRHSDGADACHGIPQGPVRFEVKHTRMIPDPRRNPSWQRPTIYDNVLYHT